MSKFIEVVDAFEQLTDTERDALAAAFERVPGPDGRDRFVLTTRMHADPRHGVVDADLRVHGVRNLYAAGASVFPTAGFANPTLTIVALSLRLADVLAGAGHPSTDGGQRS